MTKVFKPPYIATKLDTATDIPQPKIPSPLRVIVSDDASVNSAGTSDFYTVPDGKILYVMATTLSGFHNGGVTGDIVYFSARIGGRNVIWFGRVFAYGGRATVSNSYPIPIPLIAGTVLRLSSDTNCWGEATFIGYLEDTPSGYLGT